MLVEGRLKLYQWTDQNGTKRSKHSVSVESLQMLGNKDDNQQGGEYNNQQSYSQSSSYQQQPQNEVPVEVIKPKTPIPEIDIDDDEIPF